MPVTPGGIFPVMSSAFNPGKEAAAILRRPSSIKGTSREKSRKVRELQQLEKSRRKKK